MSNKDFRRIEDIDYYYIRGIVYEINEALNSGGAARLDQIDDLVYEVVFSKLEGIEESETLLFVMNIRFDYVPYKISITGHNKEGEEKVVTPAMLELANMIFEKAIDIHYSLEIQESVKDTYLAQEQ